MIGIIIPTFREKENILKLSKKLIRLHPNCKIFIVDDTKEYNLEKYFVNKKKLFIYIEKIKKVEAQQ